MGTVKRIRPAHVRAFSALCWLTYFFAYFGRYSFISGMGAMVEEGALSKAQGGLIASLFYLAYSVFQVLCGLLGDRWNARHLVLAGLAASAVCNLALPLCPGPAAMALVWTVNGAAQGMIWPPLMRLCAALLEGNQCVRVSVDLASSSPAGMVAVYLLSAWSLRSFSWRLLFWLSAAALAGAALVWGGAAGWIEARAVCVRAPAPPAGAAACQREKRKGFLHTAACAGLLCAGLAGVTNGALKDGVFTWVPTYLMENFGLAADRSALLTTVLPLVNLAGVYLVKEINRRWLQNEALASALLFFLTFLSLLAMAVGGGAPAAVALFALSTSLMMGANTALVGLMPLHFRRYGRVAAATGLLNACVHAGGAASGYLFGLLSERAGWGVLRAAWCLLALAGAACCLVQARRWAAFRSRDLV
ncbi:MFS transporter [Allofournierella sp.]|uniref:MFS transporter n=1 Tax=Allofournierella sp. TaxID=1940256 RepID=UPI003AB73FB8